jgi:hypothetical protein
MDFRFAIADFREGTRMIMIVMISTYLNHQSNLRSPFVSFKKKCPAKNSRASPLTIRNQDLYYNRIK